MRKAFKGQECANAAKPSDSTTVSPIKSDLKGKKTKCGLVKRTNDESDVKPPPPKAVPNRSECLTEPSKGVLRNGLNDAFLISNDRPSNGRYPQDRHYDNTDRRNRPYGNVDRRNDHNLNDNFVNDPKPYYRPDRERRDFTPRVPRYGDRRVESNRNTRPFPRNRRH